MSAAKQLSDEPVSYVTVQIGVEGSSMKKKISKLDNRSHVSFKSLTNIFLLELSCEMSLHKGCFTGTSIANQDELRGGVAAAKNNPLALVQTGLLGEWSSLGGAQLIWTTITIKLRL